jgi:hypothetical protein
MMFVDSFEIRVSNHTGAIGNDLYASCSLRCTCKLLLIESKSELENIVGV